MKIKNKLWLEDKNIRTSSKQHIFFCYTTILNTPSLKLNAFGWWKKNNEKEFLAVKHQMCFSSDFQVEGSREGREALLENVNKVEQLSVHAVHCLPSSILPQRLPHYAQTMNFWDFV